MGSLTRFLTLTFFLGACQLESCRSQDVGIGIARLTVRNAGALTRLIDRDTTCGFGSAAVLATPVTTGAPGELGTATWKITSGTRMVKGTITGNPKNPVIPSEAEAVRLSLEATFEDFAVRRSDSPSALTIKSGTLRWTAEPRLAVSASKGVCAVATLNVTFTDVNLNDATVFVESSDRKFTTKVSSSSYSAQVGQRGDKENWLAGELTVYGSPVHFPAPGDEPALDPEYDPAAFLKSWECADDLKQPLDFACPSLDDKVALGTARLTANLFGRLADFFDEETSCGFASDATPVLAGNVGERGGSATWTMSCTKTFTVPTAVKTDCFGASTLVTGTVTAMGKKTSQASSRVTRHNP